MDEARIDPEVREKLWANIEPHFSRAVEAILAARGKRKSEVINEMLKLAYQSGLDRGYDMGHKVFGND